MPDNIDGSNFDATLPEQAPPPPDQVGAEQPPAEPAPSAETEPTEPAQEMTDEQRAACLEKAHAEYQRAKQGE